MKVLKDENDSETFKFTYGLEQFSIGLSQTRTREIQDLSVGGNQVHFEREDRTFDLTLGLHF